VPINPPDNYTSAEVTVTPYSGPYTVGLAGSPVYVLSPLSYVNRADAEAWAKDYYFKFQVELYILSTNGIMRHNYENASLIMPSKWTILDAINADTFADNQQTVGQVFDAEQFTPEGIPIHFGNELADADYMLVITGSTVTAKSIVGTDGITSLPAPGLWVFRTGGAGAFDTPSLNSRNYAGLPPNTIIEAQDKNQESPVISILFNKSKASFIDRGFFGYPISPAQVDNLGYLRGVSYGYPGDDLSGVEWLPTVDSYPPFTSIPTILGPVIPQGETSLELIAYTEKGRYNALIAGFVPRPNDAAYNDNGTSAGRFLSGFRMRFLAIKRTIQTTEQTQTSHPDTVVGYNLIPAHTDDDFKAPVIQRVGFKYAGDVSAGWLKPKITNPYEPSLMRDTLFPFDAVFRAPIDIVPEYIDSPNAPATSTFLDGSPLLTTNPNAGPVGDNHAALVPYAFDYGAPRAPGTTGPFLYTRNDTFTGYSAINRQTQGTYWIEVEYGVSTVYTTRSVSGAETYEYGDESTLDIAMMVRRMEPPPPGIAKFIPSAATILADTFVFDGDGYAFYEDYTPVWGVQWVVSFPCDSPGHGFYVYEKWDGPSKYLGNAAIDRNTPGLRYYYPGYFDPLLEPNSPSPPAFWDRITTTLGNTFKPMTWGGVSDGELIQMTGATSYIPLGAIGVVGGNFELRPFAIIYPFEWGGSVPYSMPPPFATTLDMMGQPAGNNTYGNSEWVSGGELPEISTAIAKGNWQLLVPTPPFNHPGNSGPGLVIAKDSTAYRLPENRSIVTGLLLPYTAADPQENDAFFGKYTAPIFPPIPPRKLYAYASGVIDIFFSDDGIDLALQGFYNGSVELSINDPRNKHNLAYWQDYGNNILFDFPARGGSVLGTVDDPPGKIVLGYDSRQSIGIAGTKLIYVYASPHYATGPIRMFVNANIDLSNGKGVRGSLGTIFPPQSVSTDPPTFPPFVVLTPHSSQGPGIGVLQVECTDGTSRNVQVYLTPPRVLTK